MPATRTRQRLRLPVTAVAALFIGCINVPLANATMISLDPSDSGVIVATDTRIPAPFPIFATSYQHGSGLVGLSSSDFSPVEDNRYSSGYLIFDVSSLDITPTSAYLEFDLTAQGALDELSIWSVDTMTPSELSNLATGPLPNGATLYSDLNSGQQYGSSAVSAGSSIIQAALNDPALNAISTSADLLAFGVRHFSDDFLNGYYMAFNTSPKLVLEGHRMPLPSTVALIFIGLLAGARTRR